MASYVLGLRDRHPDNIMINYKEGNFLHIDFGHFLDNNKTKLGINREQDPFVFTPEIAYFINGRSFKKAEKFKDQKVNSKKKSASNLDFNGNYLNKE